MRTTTSGPFRLLESWASTAFLVAGVLGLSYAILKGLKAYAGLTVVTALDVLYGGFVLLVPVVALLGLYPRLREGAPRLSLAATVLMVVAGIATVAIQLQLIFSILTAKGYPEIPGDGPAWPVFALILAFITLALGFLSSALAARATESFSTSVAWLLVVPFFGWFGLIVANIVLPSGDYLGMFAYAPIGAALLAVGLRLRSDGAPTSSTESTHEPMT